MTLSSAGLEHGPLIIKKKNYEALGPGDPVIGGSGAWIFMKSEGPATVIGCMVLNYLNSLSV